MEVSTSIYRPANSRAQRVLQLGAVLSLAFGKTRRPQPTGQSPEARREADRFDKTTAGKP
jgi:hypothetical protein